MRGKEAAGTWEHWRTRITPAYAGKSFAYCSCNVSDWDHPRVCGEKLRISARLCIVMGSPPRMRGKAQQFQEQVEVAGITPAYAGKRESCQKASENSTDHPRVCGEKGNSGKSGSSSKGSPPRMRGKVIHQCKDFQQDGITPAYAGKRLKRSRSTVPHAAIVPLFPSVCNKPAGSDGSPAGHDAPPFLPIENAAPASPAYNLRSL